MRGNRIWTKLALALSATLGIAPTGAHATDGYFQDGVSIRDKGMAGAGSADPETPLILAINPAGIAEIDSGFELGVSVFSPRREFTTAGDPGFTPLGTVKSGSNYFFLPNGAISWKLDDKSAIGFSVSGNGGMNTDYPAVDNPACASPPLPAPNGVFCGGSAGVNLMQAFISLGYARQFGDVLTVGVAPVVAVQIFKVKGIAAFSYDMMGNPLTVDPAALTNNGNSWSTGIGGRVGVLLKPSETVRLSAAYQSEISMSHFDKYAGLFENAGEFDIPSNYTFGIAVDAAPNVTVMADYKHINYSDAPAVTNSSLTPAQFGSEGGPGFGWDDVDVIKFGIEAGVSDKLTLRAGASFNNNPVNAEDATINILAPGVSEEHYTVGAGFAVSERSTVNFSFLYSPTAKTTGYEITAAGPNPGHTIELAMHQYEVGIGFSHKF